MPATSEKPDSLDACNPTLNATVSASAGSGKTWLLITRMVRLLLHGAEPGNIIALTFTRKAAGEMQIRLSQRLYEMATAEDDKLDSLLTMTGCDPDAKTRSLAKGLYEKIIHSLYPVRIQTFHSFCQDILSRFPLEADIPPGFDLIEDSSLLQRQAWQMLFDEAMLSQAGTVSNTALDQLNTELDNIMQFCNGPDNTHTAISSFLSHRSDWWAFTAHTRNAVDHASCTLASQLGVTEDSDPLAIFFQENIEIKLRTFAGLLRDINIKTSIEHADIIDRALTLSEDSPDDQKRKFSLLQSAFIKKDGDMMIRGRQYNKSLEKKLGIENAERFITLHHEIAGVMLDINEQLTRILTLKINKAWYYAGNRYLEIFQQLKKEMRLLDFTDLEWKCYQLLQFADNAHWVQYKIDQRIDHILVDEFQDTNPTQWHLLSPILEEIAANPAARPRSVFLVGDEKQSIYSFRRANPALQSQASRWLAENLAARATPLDFSRRSSAAIIHSVNKIFMQDSVSPLMKGFTLHDTHLDTLPGKVLLCELFSEHYTGDAEISTEENEAGSKQTETTDVEFRNPLKQPFEGSIKTLRHKEAAYIARQIRHLKDSEELITDGDTVRTVDYGDIMILMRNRTHLDIYESTLKDYNIPYIGSKKGGLLDNLESQDLSRLLNTLVTPYDNLALAQVLKSPVFSASDDDLIKLAAYVPAGETRTGRDNRTHWYERLLQLADIDASELSTPLQRAAALIPRWQKLAEHLPVHDCLDRIFSEGNIINRYMAANRIENRHKVAANCQRFLELSLETDSGRYPSITRFLQNLEHLKTYSDSPPEEPLSQTGESRVKLMTIHGSKGLEAPIVFLADCNNTASNKNAYSSLVRWPATDDRPRNFQLQLSKENTDQVTQNLQQEKNIEQDREELNLLYVALTRAREQLFISGIENNKSKDNSWYQVIRSGLQDSCEAINTIDDIPCLAYQHLSYEADKTDPENTINTAKDNRSTVDTIGTSAIDQRLLKPIAQLPSGDKLIAPSQQPDHYLSAIAKNGADDTSSVFAVDSVNGDMRLARWRGNIIHRVLEVMCTRRDRQHDRRSDKTALSMITHRLQKQTSLHEPAYIGHLDDAIREAIATFEHPDFQEIFAPAAGTRCYNEMPLMYLLDKPAGKRQAVYGIVDRIIRSDNEITLIDYKSHRISATDDIDEIALMFKGQLDYYRQGVVKLWPESAAEDKKLTIKTGVLFTYCNRIVWLSQ